ncbi:MAG: class I SAM-dependent methyltransferase [Nanoarchaeota archaeon]
MIKQYLQLVYRLWSRIYDNYLDKIFAFDRKQVIAELKPVKGVHILEIGVGTGLNLKHYPKEVIITGIDFSESMLAQARQKHARAGIKLMHMDARYMTFRDNSFDSALGTFVLRVTPNPREVLIELARVTKPGATLIIFDQFAMHHTWLGLLNPLKLMLGWGRDYDLQDLLKGTFWRIKKRVEKGRMPGTQLVVLENNKP